MDLRVPHSWLKEAIKITKTPKEIASRVSLSGPSIDRVRKEGGDTVYEAEITTNRPDAFSILGFAREVAVILGVPFQEHLSEKKKKTAWSALKVEVKRISGKSRGAGSALGGKTHKPYTLIVDIQDPSLCRRYCGAVLDHVVVRPSPEWMRKRLELCGVRSINNVVDITNYVMLEYGQPMHAFDADKLIAKTKKGQVDLFNKRIHIRRAEKKEIIKTLDGEVKKLDPSILVITDDIQAIAIAGIKGGDASGIDSTTNTIVLESASFNPVNIRTSSRLLDLRTDASARFEKGISPEYVPYAILRAIELLKEYADASIVTDIIDAYPKKEAVPSINFSYHLLERVLGIAIPKKEAVNILVSLGFAIKETPKGLQVDIPFWRRGDVALPIDLVEEISRIYGYFRIPLRSLHGAIPLIKQEASFFWEKQTKQYLRGRGMSEIMSYSFVSEDLLRRCNIDPQYAVKPHNPLTVDFEYMRTSLIPGLLDTLMRNEQKAESFRLFELSKVYYPAKKNELPDQEMRLTGVFAKKGTEDALFFELKGIIEALLHEWFGSSVSSVLWKPVIIEKDFWKKGSAAEIALGNIYIGTVGVLRKDITDRFGLGVPVACVDIDFDATVPHMTTVKTYKQLPKYPPVLRDLALVIDKKWTYADIISTIKASDPLITRLELFDVFEHEKLGEANHSLAFHISYMSPYQTLRADEVDNVHRNVIDLIQERFGAQIRS